MNISEITLYQVLSKKFNPEEAKEIVASIKSEVESQIENKDVATKKDILEVRREISESKSEIIRWMFIFHSGLLLALAGLIFALIKFLK